MVGTGGAVRPLYPLLVRARSSVDRSDDRASLRRSKDFRLSQGHIYIDRSLLRSSFLAVTRGSTQIPYGPWGQAAPINPQPHDREWDNRRIVRPRRSTYGARPSDGNDPAGHVIPAIREELAGGRMIIFSLLSCLSRLDMRLRQRASNSAP